jgi:hypothetical protein
MLLRLFHELRLLLAAQQAAQAGAVVALRVAEVLSVGDDTLGACVGAVAGARNDVAGCAGAGARQVLVWVVVGSGRRAIGVVVGKVQERLGVGVVFGVGGAALLVAHHLVELILSGGSHDCEWLKCLAGYWRYLLGVLIVNEL